MRVMLPADRLDYLDKEMKVRIMLKNRLLRPDTYEPKYDKRIAELEKEILELSDELEEVDEALWTGKEIYI